MIRFTDNPLDLPIGGANMPGGQLFDPITAIVGGISAGTSLLGGIFKSNAAKSAAQIQAEAAQAAGKKVEDVTAATNPAILAAGKVAGDQAIGAGTEANKLLNPYATAGVTAAGVLDKGIAEGGDFNKTPTIADLEIDPGYAFRAQQGEEALTRSAAAHGAVGGGGFQKDLAGFSQGLASQEYQAAFNRFEQSQQNRFANVSSVANLGRGAAGEMGTNLIGTNEFAGTQNVNATDLTSKNTIDAARTSADYLTQGANATAAGKVASSNAIWGGIGGAANTALGTVLATRPANNYILNPRGAYGIPLASSNPIARYGIPS
jgi:hypothetical protein